jgi:hypothetical protein
MEENIKDLFQNWNKLNKQVEESFGQFEFSIIRELREKQRKIEDAIYLILLENASEDIKTLLPADCGSLEIGYDMENKIFYFVMLDPKYEESEETKLLAITIDSSKKVGLIEDFKE